MTVSKIKGAHRALCGAGLLACLAGQSLADDPYRLMWQRQVGGVNLDRGNDLAVLSDGSVVMCGTVSATPATRAWLVRFDPLGQLEWSIEWNAGSGASFSGLVGLDEGRVLVTGYSSGSFLGPSFGGNDAVMAELDSSGSIVWARQFGTPDHESAIGLVLDGFGHAYVGGVRSSTGVTSSDGVVWKMDLAGNILWTRAVGSSVFDNLADIAVDSEGRVFVAGTTEGDVGGPNAGSFDIYIARLSPGGDVLWARQLGTAFADRAGSLAIDANGDVYLAGSMGPTGPTEFYDGDFVLAKFDDSGNMLWLRQLGTTTYDALGSVVIEREGTVLAAGVTQGNIGVVHHGRRDAVLTRWDSEGNLLWSTQMGTTFDDIGNLLALGPHNSAYLGGSTSGSLGGPNVNNSVDTFLLKFGPPCPPDITTSAVPGTPGFGEPEGLVTPDDFYYYLAQFAAGNLAVADLTTTAVPGSPGYGVPNGVVDNDDYFYYLSIFASGC